MYKSSDGGEYWAKIADTLNSNPINNFYDVTVIPNEPGGYIYVSNHYGVYRSTDNGVTWQGTNFTNPGAIYIGMNTNGYMFFGNYTASWFGIYRSTDLGLTWIRHTFLSVEESMIYLRDGSVLAGCFNPGLGASGIYKTTNNGNTWENTNTFSGFVYPSDFVLDINDDIYVSIIGPNHGVYLSTNNGISWVDYGLSEIEREIMSIEIDSLGYIWAGTNMNGIYRTEGRTVPVELISFSAEVNNNTVILNWITATEINNRGFEIEKQVMSSEYGLGRWETIGFVDGYGTTTENKTYSYTDENLINGTYLYRLKQIDFDGSFEYSNVIEVTVVNPTDYFLSPNYPNPFNPDTNIDYIIPEETLVNISLYDVTGRKIKELINEKKQPGYYTIKLKGGELSSGIYFYRLVISSGFSAVKKLTIIK